MKWLFSVLSILALTSVLQAAPVPEEDKIPVDVRRTTLLVTDIDNSLELYRNALGLNVIYDQFMYRDGEQKPRLRLVLLRANDDYVGVIGLLQYMNPKKPERQEHFDTPVPGDPIIVINAQDLDQRWPTIEKTSNVEIVDAPEMVSYPRAGGGEIRAMVSMIRDPDGYWLEINKILDAPAGTGDK